MSLIVGMAVGFFVGSLLGMLPGYNNGVILLVVSVIPDKEVAVGLALGVDLASSVISILEAAPHYGVRFGRELAYHTFFSRAVSYGVVVTMFMMGTADSIDYRIVQCIAVCVGALVLVGLVKDIKGKGGGASLVVVAILASVTILVMKTSSTSSGAMFVLLGTMSVVPSLRAVLSPSKVKPVENLSTVLKGSTVAMAAAAVVVLWGLTTEATYGILGSVDESDTFSKKVASSWAAAISTCMFFLWGSTRSAAFSAGSLFTLSPNAAIGIILLAAVVGGVAMHNWEVLFSTYSYLSQGGTAKVIRIVTLCLLLVCLAVVGKGLFLVVGVTMVLVMKVMKSEKLNPELLSVPVLILPTLGFLGLI